MLVSHGTRKRITERIRRLVGGPPARTQAAALPWRKTGDGVEVLLITSRGTGRWVLPKGWPERGEPLSETAAREAREEAGIAGAVARSEAGRYFYDKGLSSGAVSKCEVLVYPMEVDRVADTWRERRQRERRWVSPDEAAAMVHEPDLAELIERFCANPRRSAA